MDIDLKNRNQEIQFVTNLKENLYDEYARKDRKGVYAFTQKKIAYNSNRIEGSTLTSEQTASLFETGSLYSAESVVYRAKDIEEMTGHFSMFNYIMNNLDTPITQEFIKQLHRHLKEGVFEDMANGYPVGEYKTRKNTVSDITVASPGEVEEKMTELLNEFDLYDMTLLDIVKFHAKYENIHPFQDGNGRTGRAIILKQCLDNNIIPALITDDTKLEYYNKLHLAQVENKYDPLLDYMLERQKEYYVDVKDMLYRTQKQEKRARSETMPRKKGRTR